MKTKLLLSFLLFYALANAQVTAGLIQEFNFNGSLNSVSGTATFINSTNTYGLDRYNNPSSALVCNTSATPIAIINNLPVGSAARTVAMWINASAVTNDNLLFTYGSAIGNAAYGGSFTGANFFQFTYASNISAASSTSPNVWKHIVMTLEANGVAKTYINGVLVTTSTLSVNTAATTTFHLGSLFSAGTPYSGRIDELKIYNRAVTAVEAKELYNGPPQAPQLVAEYNFNQTVADVNGNAPFIDYGLNTYGTDRHGNANQCYNISDRAVSAPIKNLPLGNAARSVSIWFKTTAQTSSNVVFSYGQISTDNSYGLEYKKVNTTNTIVNFPWGVNELSGPFTISNNVWKHIVCTYSATGEAIVYIDGVPLSTGTRAMWNTITTSFRLGTNQEGGTFFNGMLDDLKIYNYALSQAEVTSLFSSNTLSSKDFIKDDIEASLYPNPVTNTLNIEMSNEVKSIEIYNILGQKVLEASNKQINVSSLVSGIYMVKIQDVENEVSTKKFIKN